jgi:hypothetical protein
MMVWARIVCVVMSLEWVACGDSAGSQSPDAMIAVPDAAPSSFRSVVRGLTVVPPPGSSTLDFGLDVGSPTSSVPDGRIDNRLGAAFGTLSQFFDIQGTIDTAISHGSIILLADLQAMDLINAPGAELSLQLGANAMPAPCIDANDMTCDRHLLGTGSFTVETDSVTHDPLTGSIAGGTLTTGAGTVSVELALGVATPVRIDLHHARAKATGITTVGIDTLIIDGLVTQSDLQTKIGPAIRDAIENLIATDCAGTPKTPPTCGCTANSTGAKLIGIFDGDLAGTIPDCDVSLDELFGYPVISAVLMPDSCSTDTCDKPDSLSLGIKLKTVKATF